MSRPLVWLITGCSSGFGSAFVHQVLARGDHVIATSRNIDTKLAHFKSTKATILELDISKVTSYIKSQIAKAVAIHGRIDVLVNNAGYLNNAPFEETTQAFMEAQMQTNLFGTMQVTQAVLPYMRERKKGTLAFVGSYTPWQPSPNGTAYVGSKSAVASAVEIAKAEIQALGFAEIEFILFAPGYFYTNFFSANNVKMVKNSVEAYREWDGYIEKVTSTFGSTVRGDPVKAVKVMVDVITKSGVAQGKETPFEMPVGIDAFDGVKEKCVRTLKMLEEWESVIKSTDRDEFSGGENEAIKLRQDSSNFQSSNKP